MVYYCVVDNVVYKKSFDFNNLEIVVRRCDEKIHWTQHPFSSSKRLRNRTRP